MTTQSMIAESESTPVDSSSTTVKRYHPLLVALHWLIALMLFGAVFLVQGNEGGREGFEGSRRNFTQQGFQPGNFPSQNSVPGEAPGNFPEGGFPQRGFPQEGGGNIFSNTGLHIILGAIILVLLIIRLIVRWTTKHPEWATAGNKFFDWIGVLTHWGLYLLTFGILITGYVLGTQRGELARTFGIGTFSPGNFRRGGFNIGFLHGGMWTLLLLLIIVHIGAALYHQFILKDNLFGRMWFGKRTE